MFNGIIYQQGTVSKFSKSNSGTKIFIKSKLKLDKKDIGSSIACDGAVSYTHLTLPTMDSV